MIQTLAVKYKKHIACPLFFIFYFQLIGDVRAAERYADSENSYHRNETVTRLSPKRNNNLKISKPLAPAVFYGSNNRNAIEKKSALKAERKLNIGGPSGPEATTFKPVGSNNLVNLFTGDFSYSIPLMDVGGYPVNLFYNGGITMEQEASWVGLGWNINPGTVSRNMRGVPDDFNGDDSLVQYQNVKPNRTWGGEVGADFEFVGLKEPRVNLSLGFSYNNYLGPAIDLGIGASFSLPIMENVKYEKSATASLGLDLGLNAKLSSRSGLTLSPSLNVNTKLSGENIKAGVGLSTSYNSRTGISNLNLHEEMGFYADYDKTKFDNTNASKYTAGANVMGSLGSSSISFAKPTYMPSLRMPMENDNYSGQLEGGAGLFGGRFAGTLNGYYSESKVPVESRKIIKPLVGFIYEQNAVSHPDAVMDFNRLNDREVTPNTPIISAPEYNYDVFSIQGEGTGGSIRAYRDDMGYMRDNVTTSKDKSFSLGADIAPPGHYGVNFTTISSPTRAGGWEDANNTLAQTMVFRNKQSDSTFENVYFKNPGEGSVTREGMINRVGADDLVRFKIDGSKVSPRLESSLEVFNKNTGSYKGSIPVSNINPSAKREKRTQVITMLTAQEASHIGLDKFIRSYSGTFDLSHKLVYDSIYRVGGYRKKHHISEIDVLEQNGMRYVYGLPVYNKIQKDFTFSVGNLPASNSDNLVDFSPAETTTNGSPYMSNNSDIDGYVQSQETPAYTSSFLITGLLSPDYVDVTGNGITEDDLGSAVKFNYTESPDLYKWRTPRNNVAGHEYQAHFNEGIRTEKKDNKATISYGERESWYLNSIESKAMIAIFKTDVRNDAKGVISDMNGSIDTTKNANRKLTRIDLYTKSDIRTKGIDLATPIKSVFFVYDSSLCKGTPDSKNGGGKLTLKSIYFTYNGQVRQAKDKYVFYYGNPDSLSDNPHYAYNASDRWGTYKDPADIAVHPNGLTNIDYPYSDTSKLKSDAFAGAWSLKKILLPSGGQMEIQYESDDYAFVQDKRACNMFNIYGFGDNTSYANSSNALYRNGILGTDNEYVYIKLPQSLTATNTADLKKEIYDKYLEGINQLAFRLQVNMPFGAEPLTAYSYFDDYGVCSNSTAKDYIYIRMQPLDGKSPLAKSAIGYLTESLPEQAFPGYKTEVNSIGDFLGLAGQMLTNLKGAFQNVDNQMRAATNARTIVLANSFVRLDNPYKIKYGGGARVKRVVVKDNWKPMTKRSSNPDGEYTSMYGQDYDYTTTEKINGKEAVISSGVATYEPGIGSEENPFREILQFSSKLPMASAQYGSIEMPMLEGLYPSPMVGYSKVTVRSIHRNGTHNDSTVHSAIGKQVTEFYTSRDYPVHASYTPMNSMEYSHNPPFSFLYKEVTNRRTISQGFLVETNDMNGKMRSQSAYSESDDKTPLSASYYSYKNTGKNGMNDQVDFVYNEEGGIVKKGNMGVDIELMTDVREFKLSSSSLNGQGQVDIFPFGLFIYTLATFYPLQTYQENLYRAVTCTKLINYHAVEDSVIVMDKGSVISTKTVAYDAQTGSPVVTKTANEFNDPIYNVNYPAYWAYSGMGPAYKNIDASYTATFYDGRISGVSAGTFESGDELYILNPGVSYTNACTNEVSVDTVFKIWAYNANKDLSPLTDVAPSFIFMDRKGKLFTKANVQFRIIRSGHRNMLDANIGSVIAMADPVITVGSNRKLVVDSTNKIINASAVEFKEKWQTDNDVFSRFSTLLDTSTCTSIEVADCQGYLEKSINPYVKGLIGNFRTSQSKVFYNTRAETNVNPNSTDIRRNGYLDHFKLYWNFNTANNLIPDTGSTRWVWNSRINKENEKGLELETENALGIYSTGLYAFNKTMPVATVNNAALNETAVEGFEDYGYNETLNSVLSNPCARKHIDFDSMSNSTIINTDTTSINAHSGKFVLGIKKDSIGKMNFRVTNTLPRDFHMPFVKDTTKIFNDYGGLYENFGSTAHMPVPQFSFGGINNENPLSGGALWQNTAPDDGSIITDMNDFFYNYNLTQYLKVDATGNYTFTLNSTQHFAYALPTSPINFLHGSVTITLKDLSDNIIFTESVFATSGTMTGSGYNNVSATYTHHVPCGLYKMTCLVKTEVSLKSPQPIYGQFSSNSGYYSSLNTESLQSFYGTGSCIFTKPIPATDSMLNPLFNIPAGKKMLFSAWVREECHNLVGTPCLKTNYDSNKVIIAYSTGAADTLRPSGNVIEGWQRYDGVFTAPAASTSAVLEFVNNSKGKLYFDDIRIHPFNANMKSYIYDPRTLRLSAELDENNYAAFYEYDEEGQLVRVKKETIQGIKTIKETRSFKQKGITDIVQ